MAAEFVIRPLREADDRSSFTCGQLDLDRFFHHYAGQNQFKFRLAVTWVAVTRDRVLGFATVTGGAIERAVLPSGKQRKALPAYPLPVLRLGRLGVDVRVQKLGVGRALLRHALQLALGQRDTVGCVGVVTDAKPDAIEFYGRYGFEPLAGVREGALHGDALPMFLAIGAIPSPR